MLHDIVEWEQLQSDLVSSEDSDESDLDHCSMWWPVLRLEVEDELENDSSCILVAVKTGFLYIDIFSHITCL